MNTIRLLLLAAIWGGSFIFMRVLAPVLGPIVTADLRVSIAGVVLLLYFKVIGFDPEWRQHWKHYLVIGAVNSAIPFALYSFAALHIPAGYSVILNSTSPLFGAVFSAAWLGDALSGRKITGLLVGAAGVALVAKVGATAMSPMFFWAIAACLVAAICYALAAVYIKKFARGTKPMGIAGASQLMAGAVLLPLVPLSPSRGDVDLLIVINVLGLAIVCSSIAYLLYYRLIADVGPTKALTVTFLMPVFGMLWGVLFLGEKMTMPMAAGALLILVGTGFLHLPKKINLSSRPNLFPNCGLLINDGSLTE